ncbi:hypothetical protein BBJ28_00004520 [Nothophytophthora sp. Chile5]|nr:hypothetical protein BBJ28_00004520 [Nothophytophthora sp. Chile5]
MSAQLPSNESFFAFDGTNSDIARQLYLRAQAGASAPQFVNLAVPSTVQRRLDDLQLEWSKLPGIAQRALLWDSGFGYSPSQNAAVQIWTLGGHSMTDLAVPLDQFNAVGCVEMNCTQPDATTSYSNLYCNGEQMLEAARCVIEDFVDGATIHAAMWSTGGDPDVVPTPRVSVHAWKDKSSDISYTVFAVHTLTTDNEPAYDNCPAKTQNGGGYGSLILPCYTTANITAAIASEKQEVEGSAWVSHWLVKDYAEVAKSESNTNDSSGGGFNLVLLAPIIGGFLVVIGVLCLWFCCKRRRRGHANTDPFDDQSANLESFLPRNDKANNDLYDFNIPDRSTQATSEGTMTTTFAGIDHTIRLQSSSTFFEDDLSSGSNTTLKTLLTSEFLVGKRIPFEDLTFQNALSKGAYGEVWVCEYEGQQVAVKRLLQAKTNRAEEVEEFAKEIELSASMAHPHIVSFIGVAWNSLNNLVMVLEFFPMGDLQNYLHKNSDLLSWARDKIYLAVGVAQALEYLHCRTPPLIHRDLKSKNVLLTRNLEAKLIDFGVSRGRQEYSMTAGVGTPYWTAPEVLEGTKYTEQADIYSFGVVLSELDTCQIPYYNAVGAGGTKPKPFQILQDVMTGTLRPSFSEECPPRIRRVGVACCQHDPARRPTAAQLVKMLKGE